ncbi:endolytic transglycosylase MltG [Lederbergia sp. NSJ-179]|uniref:endolytic transglycosylase MltG n=1 Tax=Lederbergia sp. NSJ-179 TaxID=2931402 RepID=UPI001FD27C3F|nr:endolytic transglycosylase MltG [Lederbergia sp. NSJ-179]MCJ7842203.1 endolytic transglycosylase MltG [Lederbergia sp. NSJ-179]
MSAKSMRSFAMGLMIAACACGVVYYSTPNNETNAKVEEKPSVEDMKSMLTSEGYVIHTEEEWEEQLAAMKKAKENVPEEPKEKPKEKIVYHAIITVTEGMTSIDVGEALQKAHIIDKKMDFVNEVEKRKLSGKLRPGTYEVNDQMKFDEVISVFFK